MKALKADICDRLRIDHFQYVEIESKNRVLSKEAKELKKFLLKHKKLKHEKSSTSFDQFLDTPAMDLLKRGASLRLRYRSGGRRVYLQYKGPGFFRDGILFRSEFSSPNLKGLWREESHHDIIHFGNASIQRLLRIALKGPMAAAMRRHIGVPRMSRINRAPILCAYQKEKFARPLRKASLEISLDRVFAFHISRSGLHPLSTFFELENEIKAAGKSLDGKLKHLPDLLEFNALMSRQFALKPETLDKYHRCASIFLSGGRRSHA